MSEFEKMELPPTLVGDLPLEWGGYLLVIRSVAAVCKA